jgi:hypothetical protein
MSEPVGPLLLEFLAWVASRRRTYIEAMEAWRSTCPRHTVWEDAIIDGLMRVDSRGSVQQSAVILFEVVPVLTSQQAAEKIAPLL